MIARKGVAPSRRATGERATRPEGSIRELWANVRMTPDLLAFLYYLGAIITFRPPGADIAAYACLAFLAMRVQTLIIPAPLWWFLGFTAWSFLTMTMSAYGALSHDAWVLLVKLFFVGFMGVNVVRTKEQFRFTVLFCVLCFVFFPFRITATNYLLGYNLFGRAIGSLGYENPNDLAALTLLYASLAGALAFLYRTRNLRLAAGAVALGCLALVMITESRGALLALFGSTLPAVILSKHRKQLLVGTVVIAVAAALFAPARMWQRLGSLTQLSTEDGMSGVDAADTEGSAAQRYQIAQVAVAIVRDNPVVGVGVGAYHEAHAVKAAALRGELSAAGGKRDAHNTWLRIAAETGIPGLLLYIGMLVSLAIPLRRMMRSPDVPEPERIAARLVRLGLVAFFLAGMFGSLAYFNFLYVHIAFTVFLVRTAQLQPAGRTLHRGRVPVRRAAAPLHTVAPTLAR